MTYRTFVAPTGSEIRGTLESISGAAAVTWSPKGEPFDFEHAGGTEVFWDGAISVAYQGARVFICEDGAQWLEGHLIEAGEEPYPDDLVALMRRELQLASAVASLDDAVALIGAAKLEHTAGDLTGYLNALQVDLLAFASRSVREGVQAERDRRYAQAERERLCRSNHWNDGTDKCADCGADLG